MGLDILAPVGLQQGIFQRALNPVDAVSHVATVCAWCQADGVIFYGREAPSGSIWLARGPQRELLDRLNLVARIGLRGGALLVPGVPEAADEPAARLALKEWVNLCALVERRGLVWNVKLQVVL